MLSCKIKILLLVGIIIRSVLADTPIGCVNLSLAPSGGLTITRPGGSSNCQAACSGYSYAFWQQNGDQCYCLDNAGTLGMYVGSAGTDSSGGCDPNYAVGFKLGSTFGNLGCYSSVILGIAIRSSSPSVSSPDSCFSACSTYTFASFTRSATAYSCRCADGLGVVTSGNCGARDTTWFTYSHSSAARASGAARRKRREDREMLRLNQMKPCPGNLVECPVPGHIDAYECVDTQNDLESCGGCTEITVKGSSFGLNCLNIQGVNPRSVVCQSGICLISSCRAGWKLSSGRCIRSSNGKIRVNAKLRSQGVL